MLYYVLVFISLLESVIGFTVSSSSVMYFREPVKKRVLSGILLMLLSISIIFYVAVTYGRDSIDQILVFIILGIELSWFLICSKDSFFVSFFSFLTFVNLYVCISYISDTLSVNLENSAFVVSRIVIKLVIYLFITPLLFRYVRPRFRQMVDTLDKEWRFASLIPLLFLLLQIIVLYYPTPYWYWEGSNWNRFVIVIVYVLFLVTNFNLYTQANAILEKYVLENKQLLIAQQEKLWESELGRQRATTALASQQKHDMRHHNAVILNMLQKGNVEELKSYMKQYDDALDVGLTKSFCSNPIANSIFNIYAAKAEEAGIQAFFYINIPTKIGIDNLDLTCILGNVLENALEGCQRISNDVEKEMTVTVKFIDHRLRIQVMNTCQRDLLFEGELPCTQKDGGGTGIKSILYTAERYDGTAGFSALDGKFTTQIVLNANYLRKSNCP